jgi:hypothetical protein
LLPVRPRPRGEWSGSTACIRIVWFKKLRRKKIANYQAANEYLEEQYLPEHNRRFARKAAKAEDYHGRKPTARELREIFRLEAERRISNDWVIRHEGRYWQLQPAGQGRYGPTQSKALVCEWEDGAMEVYYRGQRLAYQELAGPLPRKCEVDERSKHSIAVPFFAKPRKPSPDHPWRRDYRGMKSSWSKKVELPPLRMVGRLEAALWILAAARNTRAKAGMLWVDRIADRRSQAILARNFFLENGGPAEKSKRRANWKASPIMLGLSRNI